MKFSSFTAALCYLSSLTAAAGIPRASSAVSSNIDKRQQIDKYYIHLYEHPKYQGRRADMQAAWGICRKFYLDIQYRENFLPDSFYRQHDTRKQ